MGECGHDARDAGRAASFCLARVDIQESPERSFYRMPPAPQAHSSADLVEVNGLVKRYDGVAALDGVDLHIRAGEIVGLLGRNGAGKTTLLECVLGLRTPDAGTVRIQKTDANRGEAVRVGAQLQTAGLQDHLTPREALMLFAGFYEQPAKPDALLRRFGLEEKANAKFATLSTGQKQRLFLALALVNRPQVLVLDEPTAGLDPVSRRDLHTLILEARAEGCAVLLSTHYGEEAETLCDRVAILDQGRILKMDTPSALRGPVGTVVTIASAPAPAVEIFQGLPEVAGVEPQPGGCVVRTSDPVPVLAAVTRWAEARGAQVTDVRVRPRSLEDIVVELTGRPWETGTGEGV